jgi:hydroxyethylthiazole kinase-like uncharacterized protein yjeF
VEYITPEQMLDAEREAARKGVPVERLMENAGRTVAEEVVRRYAPGGEEGVLVVAGTGNNGGDGIVAARHLSLMGVKRTSVILLANGPAGIRSDLARLNIERLAGTTVSVHFAGDLQSLNGISSLFGEAKVIIVAIFGTGIRGERVREPMAEAIRLANRSGAVRVAVDIPSGLDPLTGTLADEVIRADLTVTMHRAKMGLRGRSEYTGEVLVVPIGIPD